MVKKVNPDENEQQWTKYEASFLEEAFLFHQELNLNPSSSIEHLLQLLGPSPLQPMLGHPGSPHRLKRPLVPSISLPRSLFLCFCFLFSPFCVSLSSFITTVTQSTPPPSPFAHEKPTPQHTEQMTSWFGEKLRYFYDIMMPLCNHGN